MFFHSANARSGHAKMAGDRKFGNRWSNCGQTRSARRANRSHEGRKKTSKHLIQEDVCTQFLAKVGSLEEHFPEFMLRREYVEIDTATWKWLKGTYGNATPECQLQRLPRVSINIRDVHAYIGQEDVKLLCDEWKYFCRPRKQLQPDVSFFQNFLDSFLFSSATPLLIQNVEAVPEESKVDESPTLIWKKFSEPCDNKIEEIDNELDRSSAIETEVHDLRKKVVEVSGAIGQVMKCLSDATDKLKMFQEQQRILISEFGEQVKMLKAQPSLKLAEAGPKNCEEEALKQSNIVTLPPLHGQSQQPIVESISPPRPSEESKVEATMKQDLVSEEDEWHILEEEDDGFVVVR